MKYKGIPKKSKFVKQQKNLKSIKLKSNNNFIKEGFFIKSKKGSLYKPNCLESVRRVLKKYEKKEIKLSNSVIFDTPYTEKSSGTRMGKGKGSVKGFYSKVRAGKVLISVNNLTIEQLRFIINKSIKKLNTAEVFLNKNYIINIKKD